MLYFGVLVFFVAGVASMWQAIKNARTSQDKETGYWFTIGLILAVGALIVGITTS